MENIKNRSDLHLTVKPDNAIKWFSKINFKQTKYIDGLYMIENYKEKVVLDKPIYIGCAILDLSKLHMLKFHYNVIEKNFKNTYKLIYSDTDSLIYLIYHDDIYEWVKDNREHFDLSDSKREDMKDNTNKKRLGCFKDELNGQVMSEIVAPSPKCYAYKYAEIEAKKCKGISTAVVDKQIKFEDYKKVLDTNESLVKEVVGIRSFNQQLFTYRQDKIAITSFYDKMKMLNSIDCEPFGFIDASLETF